MKTLNFLVIAFFIVMSGLVFSDTSPSEKCSEKVLMNAEAFGFGPTAAIAEFFPYLRSQVAYLGYIGKGHTFNLQSSLPYNEMYDYEDIDPAVQREKFLALAKNYDIFITACDFEAAEWAKSLGLKVVIYDPLPWYWSTIPDAIRQADLYIAQNFFGVEERLKQESEKFPKGPNSIIVPALVVKNKSGETLQRDLLLVNLGGLSNSYFPDADLAIFAGMIFGAAREALESEFQETHYVTSKAICKATQEVCPSRTMQVHELQKILGSSKIAIMTSGLGNIYEASAMQKQIIWLPPVNSSQGQQIKLLQHHQMVDFAIDWHELLEGEEPIDYFRPQPEVCQRIAVCMGKLVADKSAQAKLRLLLKQAKDQAQESQEVPVLANLAKMFGVGGSKQAAESILQWMHSARQ